MSVLTLALCARLSWRLVSFYVHIKSLHIIIIIIIIIMSWALSRATIVGVVFRGFTVVLFDTKTDLVDGRAVPRQSISGYILYSRIFYI